MCTSAVLPFASLNFGGNTALPPFALRTRALRNDNAFLPRLRILTVSFAAAPAPLTAVTRAPVRGDAFFTVFDRTPAHPPALQRSISRCTLSPNAVSYWKSGLPFDTSCAFCSCARVQRHWVITPLAFQSPYTA